MSKIYLASSWRNRYYENVLAMLRRRGHDVYDFKTANAAFSWDEIDLQWGEWAPYEFVRALEDHKAIEAFQHDMVALIAAEVCIMVMPCGVSASLELGFAVGAYKRTAVYIPEFREPELMLKMVDKVTGSIPELVEWLEGGQ